MDDNELMTAIRERFDPVRMHIPAETIMARGRPARRRLPALAGVTVMAAAAIALAVSVLLPASGPTPVALAAWTITRAPDGTVTVTLRELRDTAGLQATLRADGVPASVSSMAGPNPACHAYIAASQVLGRVFPLERGNNVVVIRPTALPPGTGVVLDGSGLQQGHPQQPQGIAVSVGLVRTSKQCTGSAPDSTSKQGTGR